jgi:periplasmic protein TonB
MPGTSAGHLSVHVEGLHADDVPFLFERQPRRLGLSFVASAAFDVVVAILLTVASRYVPASSAASVPPSSHNTEIVWLPEQGPGGGGGGGGNQLQEPTRQAQLPGKDRLTVPVERPLTLDPPKPPQEEPAPVAPLVIPAQMLASAVDTQAGIIAPALPSPSQGPGSGGGAGTGRLGGIGPDSGSGLGQGVDAGTGGRRYQPGSGVTPPVEIYVPKPQYTADAMRARIQGKVWVECVVEMNGICTNTRVVRSLDPTFGLDEEALRAARLFRFRPGMRMGQPVPVLVTIELSFSLH